MRLREAEAREADELVVDRVRRSAGDPVAETTLDESRAKRLDRLLAPLAAHRATQPFGLPHAETRGGHRDRQHLVLEHDDAERLPQRLAQRLVLHRVLERRVLPQLSPPLDVRMNGLALNRPRANERHLDGQIVQILRSRPKKALHLRAALDLEHADGVSCLDLGVDLLVVERDSREVDRLAAQLRDLVDRLLDCREHPEAEQVDLQKARVGAGILVPLADLPARHRRRLHRDEVDERSRRDHHSARVLGDVARQSSDLARQLAERGPARPVVHTGHAIELLGDATRIPAVGDPG